MVLKSGTFCLKKSERTFFDQVAIDTKSVLTSEKCPLTKQYICIAHNIKKQSYLKADCQQ